jgi:hypothetical protein
MRCFTLLPRQPDRSAQHLASALHGDWNAYTRDRLENRIHELACAGVISLRTGRKAFQGDWTIAYRAYIVRRYRR